MPALHRRLPAATRIGKAGRRRLEPPQQRLDTFDVFETVLVRAVSPPHAIFFLVGQQARDEGLITCSAHAFDKARQAAERRAARARADEMDLSDIYAELGGALGLPDAVQQRLAELELSEEVAQLRPLPSGAAMVAESRARTGRVVYVSDMYLPADFIQQQLERHGLWQDGDALYVSLAHGCTKQGGGLFAVVAAAEGVPVEVIRHHGNHLQSDVRGAQRAGAVPVLLADGNPNRFEQALERHRDATDGLTAAMSGASRLARLELAPSSGRDRALVDVAAGVMAPVLTDYVLWLLRRAQALGLKRLYFVARDGQVLLRIAERLAPRIGCDVELRYLYASRLVWNRVVSGPSRNPQVWNSLVGLSSGGIGNRDVLERTGIGPDEVERVVAASGLDAERWRSATDRTALLAALEQIEANGTLAAAATRNKVLVMRHLEQEGLLDGVPHGFVDVGWRGTQHDALVELQTERGALPAHGLFFGLDSSASTLGHLREAYFFDSRGRSVGEAPDSLLPLGGSYLPRTRLGTPIGPADFALVEVFCSGDEGTVTDFAATPEGVVPVLVPGRREAVEAWGLPWSGARSTATCDTLP